MRLARSLRQLEHDVQTRGQRCLASCLALGAARAATLDVEVRDPAGAPVADAAVYAIRPLGRHGCASRARRVEIEQVDREFVPYLTVMQTGTTATFPNRDPILHHVYSFSPAKSFEIKLYTGTQPERGHVRQAGRRDARLQHPRLDDRLRARRIDTLFRARPTRAASRACTTCRRAPTRSTPGIRGSALALAPVDRVARRRAANRSPAVSRRCGPAQGQVQAAARPAQVLMAHQRARRGALDQAEQPRHAHRAVLRGAAGPRAGAGRLPRDPGELADRAPDDRPGARAGRARVQAAAHAEPGAARAGRGDPLGRLRLPPGDRHQRHGHDPLGAAQPRRARGRQRDDARIARQRDPRRHARPARASASRSRIPDLDPPRGHRGARRPRS